MAQSVASCGAERISLDISSIPESESANMFFDIGEITSFELQGKDKEYKGLSVKSDANTTVINGVTFTGNTQTPMELSSENVTLDRVTVDCTGYALVLKAADTNLALNRTINLISDSENTVLCKNIFLSNLNSSVVGKLNVNGNLLVNGSISGEHYITVSDGEIIYITDDDFENYLSVRSIYFDANGGNVGVESKAVPYNTQIGELPKPSRDYYTFDGWYTEADGGEKITEESIMTALADITLYAHWNHNSVSAWVSASSLPDGAEVVDRKWSYTQTYYTASSSSSLDGWNRYDSSWVWSDWGGWTGWQDSSVDGNDYRQVEKRHVYRYYNYTCSNSSCWLHKVPCYTTCPNCGSAVYENTWWETWDTTPYSYWWNNGKADKYYKSNNGVRCFTTWLNGEYTWWEENEYAQKDQWRYRDRYQIYTYYFNRSENKESSSYPTGDNISNIQEYVQYRTKQKIKTEGMGNCPYPQKCEV